LAPNDFHLSAKKSHLGSKRFGDDEEIEMGVRKWLRQQSEEFYAAGFDALVKRRGKCINVDGGYVEKYIFSPGWNTTCFTFYIYLSYLLTFVRKNQVRY
jgi:hypothetical protein